MATIKSEMPPLHAAETTATSLSSLGSGGVSSAGGGGGSNGNSTNSNSSAPATTTSTASVGNATAVNNTISAAADSSDNQPGTPQPQPQQIETQTAASSTAAASHHGFGGHSMYATASTTTSTALPHMYVGGIYAASAAGNNSHDMQQQQQQQQQHQQQHGYPTYLNSYEQFYQQQGQTQSSSNHSGGLDYGNAATLYGSSNSNDYKASSASTGVRYHPYLQTPTSNGAMGNANGNNDGHDPNSGSVTGNNGSSGAVSTTTAMSPRVVSSSSPTSTSSQLHMGGGNSGNGGNPQSPACGQQLLCKKCGIMCTNETELQEHITNVHGASPYGSSGYSSSPYIKEELTGGPPTLPQQQQQHQTGGNPGEILDLDSQKMVYPPIPGSMQSIMGAHGGLQGHQQHHAMHDSIVGDPLHSMHSMQQRALPGWDQTPSIGAQENLPGYMQQTDISSAGKPNHSPYYSPKQSPYAGGGGGVGIGVVNIKQEYPIIKSEYADSQNYIDKSFDPSLTSAPDMCQQQQQQAANSQQSMLPVSSSPAEFPSTTTGPMQEQHQQYRSFEPPTSSSALPATGVTTKAATWKSNEARRPKTYNCTACNKWFTSSGHLKRHYNTTLHKNAVKTSGQPDPATMPISVHHHPARDPSGKHSRRGGNNSAAAAAAAQQQKPPAPVQPPEPPRTPPEYATQAGVIGGSGTMSHYSTSPSPTSGAMPFGQQNGYQQQAPQTQQSYLAQVQSTNSASAAQNQAQSQSQNHHTTTGNLLNGHPNGLAGPSALITATAATPTLQMPSSQTRGLLNTTTTTTTATIKREISVEEDNINSNNNNSNNITINNSSNNNIISSQMAIAMKDKEMQIADVEVTETEMLEQLGQQQHHQLLVKQELPDLEQDYQHLLEQQHHHQQQLRHYHSSTPNSRAQSPLIISHQQYQEQLHLQQQQQQQQMVADSIYSQQQQQAHMLPPPPLQLQANTMEAYNIIPLDINTQQQHNSSMQLLQPSPRTTSTQQHMATTANMLDSIHMLQQQQQPQQSQHSHLRHLQPEHQAGREAAGQGSNMLSITTTISNMQGIQHRTNTTITPQPPHMLTPLPQLQHSITNPIIPSFQPLPLPEAQLQLEPTMTYHTIIGSNHHQNHNHSHNQNPNRSSESDCEAPSTSNDLLQLSSYDPYGNNSMFTTSDGQILQFMSNSNGSVSLMHPYFTSYPTRTAAVAESYARSYSTLTTQRSPQEADLPPASTLTYAYARSPQESQTTTFNNTAHEMPFSPTVSSSTTAAGEGNNTLLDDFSITTNTDYMKNPIKLEAKSIAAPATAKRTKRNSSTSSLNAPKRKRISSGDAAGVSTTSATIVLPSGRIKCIDCDKEFTKICYLTQHNKCFHSGEYPYRCEKCGKRFQTEDVYVTHLGRHKTQDKPHKCQLCPKQFHHKTDLRRHIEAIHTGLKQHTCDICEKSFCRKDHLRKHLETHNRPRVVSRKAANRAQAIAQRAKNNAKETLDIKTMTSEEISNERRVLASHLNDDSVDQRAELDLLVVIKNENSNGFNMHEMDDDEMHNDMPPDDESLLGDDDEDLMMSHVQRQQQPQSIVAYSVNEGIPT